MMARLWSQRTVRIVAVAAAISLIAAVSGYVLWGRHVALGFVGGVVTGAGMLSALVLVLNKLAVPADERTGATWPWALLHVAKLGAAIVVAWLVVIVWRASAIAFAAGYTVALVALLVGLSDRVDMHTGGPTWD